jgi:hypothetical protein
MLRKNASTAAALQALASALSHEHHASDAVGECASGAALFRACSAPSRSVAEVSRRVDLQVRLSATSTCSTTYTFDADVDFVGHLHLVVHMPVLVNQCKQRVTNTGSCSPGSTEPTAHRFVIPADADRPGSFAGPVLDDFVIKEGVPDCTLHVDFGHAGRRFSEAGPPLDQNAAGDFSAYYTEYAAARLVASARLVADGHEVSALTCDALAALNEVVRSCHSPSARTGSCTGTSADAGVGRAYAHMGEDASVCADLKVRSLQVQTWVVPLPFFPRGEAFPNALLRRRSRRTHRAGASDGAPADAATDLNTSLQLQLTFHPLYQLVCNGSRTLPANSHLTGSMGTVPVRTVTFPPAPSDTSAFAHHAVAHGGQPATFNPAHFRVELVVQEFLVDPESLQDLYADSRRLVSCTRVRPLDPVTVDDSENPTARVNLHEVRGGLEALFWFPRLQMDAYRHMWYRARGMVDQVTGRASCALTSHSVTVGGHAYGPAHCMRSWGRSTGKEIYACDFGSTCAGALWVSDSANGGSGSNISSSAGAGTDGVRGASRGPGHDHELACRVNANVFADNSSTGGLDAANGCGGLPAVTVLSFAMERQVLEFKDRVLASVRP